MRRLQVLALLLAVVTLASAAVPCAATIDVAHGLDHAGSMARRLVPGGWCVAQGAPATLSAACPCGCDAKPPALGTLADTSVAISSASSDPAAGFARRIAASLPAGTSSAPVRAIDHVPRHRVLPS